MMHRVLLWESDRDKETLRQQYSYAFACIINLILLYVIESQIRKL